MLMRATRSNSHAMTLNFEIISIHAEIEKLIMNYQCMIMARIDLVGTAMDIEIRFVLEIDAIVGHSIKQNDRHSVAIF